MNDRSLSRRTLLAATTATAATAAVAAGPSAASAADSGRHTERLKRLISRMSLEEKVGQLFVSRVWGHSATDPEQGYAELNLRDFGVRSAAELVARYHVGGIIYFSWADNVREPHQIADLSNGIQRAGLAQATPLPLLISVDQEHGAVTRIGDPVTQFPGAMALGAGRSRKDARSAGRIAGAELAAMGVHQNYAPVADVNVNPANPVINVRSFGSDPNAAARMVSSQVRGYRSAGVAACAKHFPGHGNTSVDSHTALPRILHTREEWSRIDAPAFRSAIAAGIDSIMTAHIQFPALDPSEDPATLSPAILTGILRGELGFDGVVVTDALNMKGVLTKYGEARVPVLALKAGADQLLYPENLALAWNAVRDAVLGGELTEDRLDESILRILRLKDRLGLLRDPYVTHPGVDRTVGIPQHLATAAEIAERTTTLLVNKEELLPLSRRRQRNLLIVGNDPNPAVRQNERPVAALRKSFAELGFTPTALPFEKAPTPAQIDQAVAAAAGQDAVIVTTYNVDGASSQRTLVSRLVATGVPVITLALRNPYDIARLGEVSAALASYGWSAVELRAAARVIAGRVEPEGKLPVPVLRADDPTAVLFPAGHGLRYDG
ncbi:glycoside hydrolase family 3 protein [Streptomyces amakusaensis]|uniref:beta-N-acetylhexosaminidase n=1 Tax=Streptomyces amakusaensis TaxID=67271 RepID=A0ABW0AEM8_9ACTN